MSEVYVTNGTDLEAIADKIREKTGTTEKLTFPNGFISAIPDSIPKEAKIKYIIPARLTCTEATSGTGIGAITFSFTRENVNQFFFVDWQLTDAVDFATKGVWLQHFMWALYHQGNYNTQHNISAVLLGSGSGGNYVDNTHLNMAKTGLTQSVTFKQFTTTNAGYERWGRNFKGLIFIYDSTYDGLPIIDETKLSQFFTCDNLSAGW